MATVDVLQARLEKLKAARALGVLSARHGDVHLTYRSLDEMSRAIGLIEQEIAAAAGSKIVRTVRLTSSKDL